VRVGNRAETSMSHNNDWMSATLCCEHFETEKLFRDVQLGCFSIAVPAAEEHAALDRHEPCFSHAVIEWAPRNPAH